MEFTTLQMVIDDIKSHDQLPTELKLKEYVDSLLKNNVYKKNSAARNDIASKLGYRTYKALKDNLTVVQDLEENDLIRTVSFDDFRKMMEEEIFYNALPNIEFTEEYYYKNQTNKIDGICIDPVLPKAFWSTDNKEREVDELNNWWQRPFITTQEFTIEPYESYKARIEDWNKQLKEHYKDEANLTEIESEEAYYNRKEDEKASWYSHWLSGIRYDVCILDGGAWDRPTFKAKVGTLEEALKIAKELESNVDFKRDLEYQGF